MLGNLPMRSKEHKSLMNSSTFGQSTSNEHILIIIYHFKVIIFAQKSWGCELHLHISLKYSKCLKVAWRSQKIMGHFTKFNQLHKIITFSIFGIFECSFCQMFLERSTSYHIWKSRENFEWKGKFEEETL